VLRPLDDRTTSVLNRRRWRHAKRFERNGYGAHREPAQQVSASHASTDLGGQVALVTGATAGLARRFATVLADSGAAVVLAGRRLERLQQVADEISERGDRCTLVAMDVSRPAGLGHALDRAEQAFGTITILVNNAAIPDAQRAHRMSLELIDAVIDTNLRGPFVLTCEVARRLITAGLPGRIINLSSMGVITTKATELLCTR
jgi:NAD(P)-dependent dehydrogenase (short-subunit alcohol dehydrogenase family)